MKLRYELWLLIAIISSSTASDMQHLRVPDLPAWVIAPAFTVDAMPNVTPAERSKSCTFEVKGHSFGDNGQKDAAIMYVRQVRYIDVLKAYLDKQSQNITQRKQFIDGLRNQIAIRRDRITALKDLIQHDQILLTTNIKSLAQQKQNLAQLQQKFQSSSLQQVMNDTIKGLQDAQNLLKQAQAIAGKKIILDPVNQQHIVFYAQWIKYFQAQGQTLIQDAQKQLDVLKKQYSAYNAAAQKNSQYKPYSAVAEKAVSAAQKVVDVLTQQNTQAQGTLARELLQRVQQADVSSFALDQAYQTSQAHVYQQRMLTDQDLQVALSALPSSGSDYSSLVQRIQSNIQTQMADLQKSFDAQAQTELFMYQDAINQAKFFVAQQDYYNKVITDHQNEITRLQKEIEKLIDQIQRISEVIIKQLVPTINAVKGCAPGEPCVTIAADGFMSIQDLLVKIQNPSNQIFNGCPYFLQDLLKK